MNQKNTHDIDESVATMLEGAPLVPPVPSVAKARRIYRKVLRLINSANRTNEYTKMLEFKSAGFTQDYS